MSTHDTLDFLNLVPVREQRATPQSKGVTESDLDFLNLDPIPEDDTEVESGQVKQTDSYEDIGFVEEVGRVIGTAAEGLAQSFTEIPFDIGEILGMDVDRSVIPEYDFVDDPTTTVGWVASSALQFMVPYLGVARGLTWAVKLSKLKNIKSLEFMRKPANWKQRTAKAGAIGATTDFIAFSPSDGNLSTIVQQHPELQNPITALLASDADDPAVLNRFRNSVEGLGLGILADSIIRGLTKGLVPATGKAIKITDEKVFKGSLMKAASWYESKIIQRGFRADLGSQKQVEDAIKQGTLKETDLVAVNAWHEYQLVHPDAIELKRAAFETGTMRMQTNAAGEAKYVHTGESLGDIVDDVIALNKKHPTAYGHWEEFIRDSYRLNILRDIKNKRARVKNRRAKAETLKATDKKAAAKLNKEATAIENTIKPLEDGVTIKSVKANLDLISSSPHGKEIKALQQRNTAFNERMLDMSEDFGIINKETRKKLDAEHVFLFRNVEIDYTSKVKTERKSLMSPTKSQRKDLSGRKDLSEIGNITQNMVRGFSNMIDSALVNKVKLSHIELAKRMGKRGNAWIRKAEKKDAGSDKLHTVFVNGKKQNFIVEDTFLLDSFNALGPDASSLLSGVGCRWFKWLRFYLSPCF